MSRQNFRPAPLALAIALALGATAVGAQGTAQPDAPVPISIQAQPLAEALNGWARQTRIQVIASQGLVAGKTAPAVSGTLTPGQALERLLAGSGLVAVREGNAVVIKAAPSAADAATLKEVTVTAQAETATGPARGLVARRSATGTKTDTPLIETPQSITVVTAEQMRTLRSGDVAQALEYSAGVLPVSGYGASYDAIYSRGFWIDTSNSQFADGLRQSAGGWSGGKQEPYGLERVELVKGAASVLYGMAAPGGVVSIVSKRPTGERVREVVAEVGSYSHRQIGVDLGDSMGPDSDWDWRLTAQARESGTPIGPLRNDGIYIAPALRWSPSAATSLTLLLQHQQRELGWRSWLPTMGMLVPGAGGAFIPRYTFAGEPGIDKQEVTQNALTALFEHRFSDDATLRSNLRLVKSRVTAPFTGLSSTTDDPRVWTRNAFDILYHEHGFASDTHWQQRLRFGGAEHTLLAGVDYMRFRNSEDSYRASIAPIDVYAPVYGALPGAYTPSWLWRTDSKQTGVYVQDQIKWGERWVLLAGLRHDSSSIASGDARDAALKTEDTSALTGRLGVVYLAPGGWAPFAGYSQSFQPQGGVDAQGQRFDPTEGEQMELGLRWQPPGQDLLLSASLFDLRKTNVLTTDPANPNFSVQTGEQRSRGLELEARGQVTRNLELVGAYAYIDRRTTQSNRPEEVGRREATQPYHQASLWGSYRLSAWGLPAWTVGAGLRYTGSTLDRNWRDGVVRGVPGYTLADLMVAWEDGPWRVALNARNAFDKAYVTCGTGSCWFGDPRTVKLSATYRW